MDQCASKIVYQEEGEGRFFSLSYLSRFIFLSSLSNIQKTPTLILCIRASLNPKHPTRLYRARLGFRKQDASKPSRFFSLPKSPRKKLPFSVPSMYMRIYTLIQLNETIFSHNGRGKFRPHPRLGFAEIFLGFWFNIGPLFSAQLIMYLPYSEWIIFPIKIAHYHIMIHNFNLEYFLIVIYYKQESMINFRIISTKLSN